MMKESNLNKAQLEIDKWDAVYADMPLPNINEVSGFDDEFVKSVANILLPGSSILEAGCGGGGQSVALAKTGKYRMSLMDFSEKALDYAKRYFHNEGLKADFILEDVFSAETSTHADLVFNAGVLEHYQYEEQVEFVQSMANRANKLVLVLVPNTHCYWYWLWRQQNMVNNQWPYGYEVPASDYKDIMIDAGLKYLGKFYFGERWTEDFIRSFEGLEQRAIDSLLSLHQNQLIPDASKCYMVGFLAAVDNINDFDNLKLNNEAIYGGRFSDRQTAALGDALANQVRMMNQLKEAVDEKKAVLEQNKSNQKAWRTAEEKFENIISDKEKLILEQNQYLEQNRKELLTEYYRLNKVVEQRDESVNALNKALSSSQREYLQEIERLNKVVEQRDESVTALNKTLSSSQCEYLQEIERLNKVVEQRDESVTALNKALFSSQREYLQEIEKLNKVVELRDESVNALNKASTSSQIGYAQEVDRLKKAIEERDIIIMKANQREIETESLHDELVSQQQTIEALKCKMFEQSQQHLTEYQTLQKLLKHNEDRLVSKDEELNLITAEYNSLYESYTIRTDELNQEYVSILGPIKRVIRQFMTFGKRKHEVTKRLPFTLLSSDNVVLFEKDEWQENIMLAKGSCYDVILFPVIDWHFRVQRPQHLVRELAHKGSRAFYLTTTFFESNVPDYKVLESPEKNVFVVQLACQSPCPNIYKDILDESQQQFLLSGIKKMIMNYKLDSMACIIDLPFWGPVADKIPSSVMVYDCMDHHAGFSTNSDEMLNSEDRLLDSSDLVISTSALLSENLSKKVDNVLIRNAGEIEFFADKPVELKINSTRPIVGYYGAISDWFDIALVVKAAKIFPEWDFALVGNVTDLDISAAEKMTNIQFYGEVPYADLPSYLYAFDVCTIPFLINDLTLCTNPVKVYEYLAAGKPVVATAMPELKMIDDMCHVCEQHDEYIQKLSIAMEESKNSELHQKRALWAKQHDWSSRAEELDNAIIETFAKVSVIVLTYNNLEYTQACLHSLEINTNYPNWELIIVDNASSDGTPRFLKEYEQLHTNVKVILNNNNLGFSAGNNVGLKAATGDYLVILNNDTYVTQGWLSGLIKPLSENPNIGIVGPVTNNIGNEAKIDINYTDMVEMAINAENYTSAHFEQLLFVNTVAFFCVAFTKDVFEQVGLMDEDFGVGFFEDDDYCNRVRAIDRKVAIVEDVFVHHHLSASFNKLKAEEKQKLFEKNKTIYESKWGTWKPHTYR